MMVGFIYVLIKNIINELFRLNSFGVLPELSNALPCLITPSLSIINQKQLKIEKLWG